MEFTDAENRWVVAGSWGRDKRRWAKSGKVVKRGKIPVIKFILGMQYRT